MPSYSAFIDKIQDWANKDETVLKNPVVQDCMKYAADNVYRRLRVTALEQTVTYSKTQLDAATTSANNRAASKTELTIPADLTEFIQLREIDDDGRTCRVFNEKTDLRTFNDIYAEKTQAAYWSRVGNVLIYSPGFGTGFTAFTPTKAELHYYKRLPALNALYDVTPANFTAGYLTPNADGTFLYNVTASASIKYATHAEAVTADTTKITGTFPGSGSATHENIEVTFADAATANKCVADMELSGTNISLNTVTGAPPKIASVANGSTTSKKNITLQNTNEAQTRIGQTVTLSATTSTKYVGNEVAHWLRDENEKLLLYGSLAECFYYLQDEDQAKKYNQLFIQELAQLNDEDNKRGASGGNVQINFNGRGLI
tara:strand:+ start:629 stop:1747 length:1119 start_codon:yes stop_codon:yes gene_type:complete